MGIRVKITSKAAPFLEPGEQVQVAFAGQTASQWLMLMGVVWFLLINKYRNVVVTDRRILVLDSGKFAQAAPKSVIASLPRATKFGPPTGVLFCKLTVGNESIRVHRRFYGDITQADRLAGL